MPIEHVNTIVASMYGSKYETWNKEQSGTFSGCSI